MRLTLYYAPIACSLVPLVTLHESGAQFEVKPISLKNGQQHDADYLRINPKAKVPVLVVDGEALTENVAILTRLASAFPTAKLLPTNPKNAIRALSLMAWCASGLHPPLTRIFDPARYCTVPGSEESIRKLAVEEVIKNFRIVDGMLAGKEWMFDHWTAVDAYLFWVWRRFGVFKIEIPPFPSYAAHGERMMKRESVKRALAFEREVLDRAAKAA
ncbi:MAG TPA: glutathione S-transferase N-terminal domain-containing protein [Burkholderiales bacterium]